MLDLLIWVSSFYFSPLFIDLYACFAFILFSFFFLCLHLENLLF